MNNCPTCGKPVDPLRARAVGVRDGKVVGYCSRECAQVAGAESKPTYMPQLDSGPVIEIIHEPASGVVTSARDARGDKTPIPTKIEPEKDKSKRDDTTLKKWTVEDDEAVPDPDRSGIRISDFEERRKRELTPLPIAPRSNTLLIVVAVLVVLGAGAFFAYRFLIAKPDASASATKPDTPPKPPEVVVDAAPVAVAPDPNAAVAQAMQLLRDTMTSESPRMQRAAAMALARTKDPAALDLLAKLLAKETTDVGKRELAYALARAGDERGTTVLVAKLSSARRDDKLEAGMLLARLDDPRAAKSLGPFLELGQFRVGAAEQLARLKDERAIKLLESVRADAKTSPEDRARATIALGLAGRTDVIPDIQALLSNARFNKDAASALAQLGDPTARAVLAEQLGIQALRVEAARSLRRLEPTLDPAPLLAELVPLLASKKDTEQVQVAEAILLLAGDAAWSERL